MKAKNVTQILVLGLILLFEIGCRSSKNVKTGSGKILVRIVNNNVSEGDAPAVSTSADGSNMREVPLNRSIEIILEGDNISTIYLWTCPSDPESCTWQSYAVPSKKGGSVVYNEHNPHHRNITVTYLKNL